MNASDFFKFVVEKNSANTRGGGCLQELGYFWCGVIDFCIFGAVCEELLCSTLNDRTVRRTVWKPGVASLLLIEAAFAFAPPWPQTIPGKCYSRRAGANLPAMIGR